MKRKRQRDLAVIALVLDLCVEMAEQADLAFIAEANHVARRQFLRRLDQRLPARAIEALDQCRVDLRLGVAADAAAPELRGDYLGVVHHQLVAGLEPVGKVGYPAVVQDAVGLHHQKARGIPRACGAQRDVFRREFEVEEIGAHGADALPRLSCNVIPGHAQREPGISRFRVRPCGLPRHDGLASRRVQRHARLDDLVGILDRLAALDLVDVLHA